ncbi:MAG: hypothetical protein ACOX0X_02140 [Candidatus Dojkabacteria bacterium]
MIQGIIENKILKTIAMEIERRESLDEREKECLVYSYEIVRAAIQNGWRIKIFQRDVNLKYLYSILLDIEIDPDAFFSFKEFSSRENVFSAYDWAREVQKTASEKYGLECRNLTEALSTLDIAYKEDNEPWEVFSNKELVDVEIECSNMIKKIYSLE